MKINRKLLYAKYMEEVNRICEINENRQSFEPAEIIRIICEIIEKDGSIYSVHEFRNNTK